MRLTSDQRRHLSPKSFALPGRRFPIPDPPHARNALARASEYATPAEQAKVRAAVHRKFPSIGKAKGGVIEPDDSLNTSAADSTSLAKHCPSCTCLAHGGKAQREGKPSVSEALRRTLIIHHGRG